MKQKWFFRGIMIWVAVSVCSLYPLTASAGKVFLRDKLEKKINESSNIQFQRNASSLPAPVGNAAQQRLSQTPQQDKSDLINYNNPAFSQYAVYQTNYKAELEDNVVTVEGRAVFEVFEDGWTQIPLISTDVGLINVSVNRGMAYVTMHGNKYFLMIEEAGRYRLDFEFLIRAHRERENGPGNFHFDVIAAPISQYEFVMSDTGIQIFVEPAIRVEVEEKGTTTVAWAVMPNTNSIKTRWTKALPKEKISPVKLDPKIYAKTATYTSVGEGIVRCQSEVSLSVLQAETTNFRILLSKDTSLLDVSGKDIRDWKVTQEDENQYLDVYLNFGVKGNYSLNLTYEKNIGQGSVVAAIPQIKVLGVERENGHLGIAAKTNVELAVNTLKNATRIDTKELPSSIWRRSSSPILLAFKYLNHPFGVTIDVTRHEELPVLISAIDTADYTTVHTEEGKALTSVTFQVRNNVKQFLRLGLPQDATLWSAFVAGKPVKPAKDAENIILIPLEKSRLEGESLTRFPVEVVYLDKSVKIEKVGKVALELPKTDIPVSELLWRIYMPEDYIYYQFSGDVKKQQYLNYNRNRAQRSRTARSFIGGQDVDRLASTQYEPYYLQEKAQNISQKFKDYQSPSVQQAGAMPIRVNIPKRGKIINFSKLLVTDNESPQVTFKYIKSYPRVMMVLRILFTLAVIILGIKFFIRLFRRKRTKKAGLRPGEQNKQSE